MATAKASSAGVALGQVAVAAVLQSRGDRERIAAMDYARTLAVKNRFAFDKLDVLSLERMCIRTCVGVLRPLEDHYCLLACLSRGTYAHVGSPRRTSSLIK
ncbi:hypothetical protein AWB81_08042 [Caballeronia arationis]|uniref:hypothetical protein n=1 Tax=Caballeronia arationis TaxID=1777142 RepID=UPI00074B77B7|nr:hypothetical protein [Caballeronia arationis]SAL07364.1 hypothetical protein AWB81_08042 [Caballeronia arationis]